jgi:hypothetical protein
MRENEVSFARYYARELFSRRTLYFFAVICVFDAALHLAGWR